MNRGSDASLPTRFRAAPRFNEAPIHESGKLDDGVAVAVVGLASMRPRFMNRGSAHYDSPPHSRRAASMRPRFMNRGSVPLLHGPRPGQHPASMRPRFMNRGSRKDPKSCPLARAMLQ